jgi:hypothetical protein
MRVDLQVQEDGVGPVVSDLTGRRRALVRVSRMNAG